MRLFKEMKRGAAKEISSLDTASVGFSKKAETVRINVDGHFLTVSAAEIDFLIKQLPLAQMKLNDSLTAI